MSQSFSEDSPGIDPAPSLSDQLDRFLLWVDRLRDHPVVASIAVGVVVLIAVSGWWLVKPSQALPVEDLIPRAPGGTADPGTTDPAIGGASASPPINPEIGSEPVEIVVHVVGAVRKPGLVTLESESRVSDAIEAAGGPTTDAEIHILNLAAPVADGMQINVPRIGEDPTGPLIRGGQPTGDATSQVIDLNRATNIELELLPGVGPATATAIVEWRETHGGFASVDDLLSVPGIGPAKLEALRDLVKV